MLQGADPKVPVLVPSLGGYRTVIATVLLPNRAPVKRGRMNVVVAQQPVRVKRACLPAAVALSKAFRVAVDDANFGIRVEDLDSSVYPAGAHVIVGIQRKDVVPMRGPYPGVPGRRQSPVLLTNDFDASRAQILECLPRSLIRRAIIYYDQFQVLPLRANHAFDGFTDKLSMIEARNYHRNSKGLAHHDACHAARIATPLCWKRRMDVVPPQRLAAKKAGDLVKHRLQARVPSLWAEKSLRPEYAAILLERFFYRLPISRSFLPKWPGHSARKIPVDVFPLSGRVWTARFIIDKLIHDLESTVPQNIQVSESFES